MKLGQLTRRAEQVAKRRDVVYHTASKENEVKVEPIIVNEPAVSQTPRKDTTSDKLAQIEQLLNMSAARGDKDEVINHLRTSLRRLDPMHIA